MAVFESFTFNPSTRHPSSSTYNVMQVSPMSTPTSAYEPSSRRNSQAISDLAHRFSEQRISKSSPPPSYFDIPVAPDAVPAFQEPSSSERHRERSWSPPIGGYRRMSGAAIRAQRQANIRLLTDSSHLRELSALVEQMVDSESQCRICTVTSASSSTLASPTSSIAVSSPQSPVDKAIDEIEVAEDDEMADYAPMATPKFIRSGDVAAMAAAGVSKVARVRKQRRQRSSVGR